jgi:hypothetical protein
MFALTASMLLGSAQWLDRHLGHRLGPIINEAQNVFLIRAFFFFFFFFFIKT